MRPPEDRSQAEPDIYRARFERCFDQHYVRIFAFAARRVAGRDGAEDAVADTFAIAWRRRDMIPAEPLPWLYAIAANVIANQYRSTRRRRDLEVRLADEAGAGARTPDPAEALARRDGFSAAFAALGEGDREVLRLVAWDGLDVGEAASVLGCSPGAFRVRLHRARRKLQKRLEAAGQLDRKSRNATSRPAKEAR
jgi:RNA polymerase sigma-70 factor, ECF subfamily